MENATKSHETQNRGKFFSRNPETLYTCIYIKGKHIHLLFSPPFTTHRNPKHKANPSDDETELLITASRTKNAQEHHKPYQPEEGRTETKILKCKAMNKETKAQGNPTEKREKNPNPQRTKRARQNSYLESRNRKLQKHDGEGQKSTELGAVKELRRPGMQRNGVKLAGNTGESTAKILHASRRAPRSRQTAHYARPAPNYNFRQPNSSYSSMFKVRKKNTLFWGKI